MVLSEYDGGPERRRRQTKPDRSNATSVVAGLFVAEGGEVPKRISPLDREACVRPTSTREPEQRSFEEVPMIKQLIVLSSLLVGAGSAGTAMYLQANPHALSRGQRVNLETYLYSARPDTAATEVPATPAVEEDVVYDFPEDRITVSKPGLRPVSHPARPAAVEKVAPEPEAAPSEAPKPLHPCSNFREIGPMNVDDGVPSGVRGVRDLC